MSEEQKERPWAILLAVGPGDRELARLADLAESIAVYAADVGRIMIVDDAQRPERLIAAFPVALRGRVRCVSNRKVRGVVGWRDGLTVGIWMGLKALAEEGLWDFVLKVDTDSLLIASPQAAIRRRFAAPDRPALIGRYYTTSEHEHEEWRAYEPYINVMERLFCDYRDPITGRRRIHAGFTPRSFRRRRLLRSAKSHGYVPSEHCQGGGYALHGKALEALRCKGLLGDYRLWANLAFGEDVALALTIRSVGLPLGCADGEGQAFGVRYQGLPAAPEELVQRGNAVIHSVKSDHANEESEVRAFFRNRRSERGGQGKGGSKQDTSDRIGRRQVETGTGSERQI